MVHEHLELFVGADDAAAARAGRRPHFQPSEELRCRWSSHSDDLGIAAFGWNRETPLRLYRLKEAQSFHDGRRLGPVGSCIVAEVLTAVLDADPDSYRNVAPDWAPTLPHAGKDFTLGDLLRSATESPDDA